MNIEEYYNFSYKKKVSTVSRILENNFAAAEDIVQEAFARALAFYPSYDPNRGSIDKWFNSIMFNALKDYQKSEKGIVYTDPDDLSALDVLDVKQATNGKKLNSLLESAIMHIKNETHRRVLQLFYLMGYSSKEISQIEHRVSQTNVTTLVMRFRDSLRKEGVVI